MDIFWCVLLFLIGFGAGAVSAFLLGKRFLRKDNRRLYERWRRRERTHRRKWISQLTHDLKNPLFLIQAFTWNYLDRVKKRKIPASQINKTSKKMAETLNRQAEKAIEILKKAPTKTKPH
jgi:hypothetical protein